MVQWLRLSAPNPGDSDLTPGQGTRSYMPHLKILHATTTTQCSQIKIHTKIFNVYNQLHLLPTPPLFTLCVSSSLPSQLLRLVLCCLKAHPRFANSYLPFRSQRSARDEGRKEQGTNGKSVLLTPGFWRPS